MTANIRLLGTNEEIEPILATLAYIYRDRFKFKDCLAARNGWRWYCEITDRVPVASESEPEQ